MALEAPETMRTCKSALDFIPDHHHQQHQEAVLASKTAASATLFDTRKDIFPASQDVRPESPLRSSSSVDSPAQDAAALIPQAIHSPLQERCEDLESELSALRSRLQKSELSSAIEAKRLSEFQQSSSTTQQSLQTLKQQHELTLSQLVEAQSEAGLYRHRLEAQGNEVEQLRSQVQEQGRELREVLLDRDSLSMEMAECHMDNAKFLKRLRASNDKVERLQHENRHLIEQLRESRAGAAEAVRTKAKIAEALERERARAGEAALDLERVVARYKEEVERLQNLVLAMGHKHVQIQARLNFLQRQAEEQLQAQHKPRLAIEQTGHQGQSSTLPSLMRAKSDTSRSGVSSASEAIFPASDPVITDDSLKAILSSIATTATTRRSKPTRRFTVNASFHREEPLSLEQRKSGFLMDQITVLQRGYDSLRQEKLTLELQLDLMQRQYQFHQQQRQNRLDSGRRGVLGQDEYLPQPHHRPSPITALITGPQEIGYDLEDTASSDIPDNGSSLMKRAAGKEFKTLDNSDGQEYGTEQDREQGQINGIEHGPELYQHAVSSNDPQAEWMVHAADAQTQQGAEQQLLLKGLEQRVRKSGANISFSSNLPSSVVPNKIQSACDPREQDVEQCSCCMGGLIEL
ncbi:hypothetical protein BGZ70_002652 [Mortierella alpina]|uniref:Uncharacterized protein n=1 Tax=Mortierella alpina TaxID=64518 RepID=A0A9P6M5H2_MORAP|nr:hypothetical protein BGZ70_002652 [Mortierella alpina]